MRDRVAFRVPFITVGIYAPGTAVFILSALGAYGGKDAAVAVALEQ